MSPQHKLISTIFTTKNNELAIFGQTLTDVTNKLINFNDVIMQGGSFGNKSTKPQLIAESDMFEILSKEEATNIASTLDNIKNKTDQTWASMDDYLTYLDGKGRGYIKNYVKENQNQIYVTDDVIDASKQARQAQLDHNAAIQATTLSAKVGQVALKGLAIAGNMIAMWAVTKVIQSVAEALDNYVHRVEKAQEATLEAISTYEDITSEVENLDQKIEELDKQIKDLDQITDAEDIENLKAETEELNTQLKILQEKQRLAKEEADETARKSLGMTQTSKYATEEQERYSISDGSTTVNLITPVTTLVAKNVTQQEELEYAMEAWRDYAEKKKELEKELSTMNAESKEFEKTEQAISDLEKEMSSAKSHANELAVAIQEQADGLDSTSSKELKDSIDGTLKSYANFTDEINTNTDALNANAEAQSQTASESGSLFSYDKLGEIPQKLSEVENAYKTAQDALDSYNKKGYYSMDIIDSILSLEDEYINVLVDENGQLQVNSDSMNKLCAIKIETAKASIYQETCEELVRIKTLDTALAAQELALINGTLTESAYETAKALYEEVQAMGGANAVLAGKVWESASKKVKLLDNQLKSLNNNTYNVGVSAMAEDAEKATKEYIESFMDLQEKALESGRIDYKTYCDSVSSMLKNMFNEGKIAAKDYHSYTKQMLEYQKSIMDRVISAVVNRLDEEIEKYDKLIEEIEKTNDSLEEQKSIMESASNAVVNYLDKQLENYSSLINVSDKYYEKVQKNLEMEKEAIQDKIDALNDENSALDLKYRKQQALYELERSKNQRANLTYTSDQGFIYKTNETLSSENKKTLEDIQREELIYNLEKEQNALDDSISALQEYRDTINSITDAYGELIDIQNVVALFGQNYMDVIKKMNVEDWNMLKDKLIFFETQKEEWSSLSNTISFETDKQNATILFGSNWEEDVNNNRLITFNEFKDNYLDIQNQINDNTQLITSYEEKQTYYQQLKEEWQDITDAYEREMNEQYAIQILGADWESKILSGRLDTLNDFAETYSEIQQAIADAAWASAIEQINAINAVKAAEANAGYNGNAGDSETIDYSQAGNGFTKKTSVNESTESFRNRQDEIYHNKMDDLLLRYSTGTENAKKGIHEVSENGDEIIIDNNNNAILAKGHQLYNFEGGETVIKASETSQLLKNQGNFVPVETLFSNIDTSKFMQNMPNITPNISMPKFDYSKLGNGGGTIYNVGDISITCPGVTSQEVAKQLVPALERELFGMSNYAKQKMSITR